MIGAAILLFALIRIENTVERYINSVIVWTIFCYTITEILSVFHAVNTVSLWLCWGGIDVVLLSFCFVKYKNQGWKNSLSMREGKHIDGKVIAWGVFAIGMIFLALKTVPYNWDSMTYHLPRVVHWLQNGTVAHYATHNDRQVASPVLGAFINLHVYAMANGNDTFVNLLQCCSYLTNGMLVYSIAKKLKCSEKYCVIALVLFYSMPIAFAEALTTQVDNFSTFWMLSFSYLILDLLKPEEKIVFEKKMLFKVVNLSLCIAFGYLAKPSIGFGILFFALWLLIVVIRRKDKILTLAAYIAIACMVITAITSPEFYRNYETYGALSSSGTGQRQLIGTLHERYLLVNGVKNFTFNMPTVWIYNSKDTVWKYTVRLARALDIDLDDPLISEDGREYEVRDPQNYGHDSAVNPVIIWLMIVCIFVIIFKNGKEHLSEIKNQFFVVACMSFCFFCMVLRWEPFVSRYMLSYLAILCPAVSGQLEMLFDGKGERNRTNEIKFLTILYFLCITEFGGLVYFHGKIARNQTDNRGYFTNRWEIADNYVRMADWINDKGYRNIGLLIGGDSYEYPLMALLDNYDHIEHVNVENETEKYEDHNFVPDVIISIEYDFPQRNFVCHNNEYEVAEKVAEDFYLLEKVVTD